MVCRRQRMVPRDKLTCLDSNCSCRDGLASGQLHQWIPLVSAFRSVCPSVDSGRDGAVGLAKGRIRGDGTLPSSHMRSTSARRGGSSALWSCLSTTLQQVIGSPKARVSGSVRMIMILTTRSGCRVAAKVAATLGSRKKVVFLTSDAKCSKCLVQPSYQSRPSAATSLFRCVNLDVALSQHARCCLHNS